MTTVFDTTFCVTDDCKRRHRCRRWLSPKVKRDAERQGIKELWMCRPPEECYRQENTTDE